MATLTNLDDEIFAQPALEGFVSTLFPLRSFSTNFSPDAMTRGNNVLVPLIGALTATTFGGSYAISGGSQSVVTVTLNGHKVVHVGQDDLTHASSSASNLERYAFQQGAALATEVMQNIAGLFITGASGYGLATAVAVASFAAAQIRAGRLQLGRQKCPLVGRSMILDVEPFDNLLGITSFITVNESGTSEGLREGRVGRLFGIDIFETNAWNAVLSSMGFMGGPAAVAVAMRYLAPQDGNTYLTATPIVHAETGLTMGLRDFYDNATGTRYRTLECLFGKSVGISSAGLVIKRTD